MKAIYIALGVLLTASCSADKLELDPAEAYKVFSPRLSSNENCFYEHNPTSDFVIEDSRLIQTSKLNDMQTVIFAICAPGMYQDKYLSFLVTNNDLSTAKPLIFLVPHYDFNSRKWSLIKSELVPGLILPQEKGKLILGNNSGCAGGCGYIAEYDSAMINSDSPIAPLHVRANEDVEKAMPDDQWPVVTFD